MKKQTLIIIIIFVHFFYFFYAKEIYITKKLLIGLYACTLLFSLILDLLGNQTQDFERQATDVAERGSEASQEGPDAETLWPADNLNDAAQVDDVLLQAIKIHLGLKRQGFLGYEADSWVFPDCRIIHSE